MKCSTVAFAVLAVVVGVAQLEAAIGAFDFDARATGTTLHARPTGTIRHDRPDSSYTGLAAAYPSVGDLLWGGYRGSGTLIVNPTGTGSHWVLTAAHCLDHATSAGSYSFNLSDGGGSTHSGDKKFIYPSWTGDLEQGYDIGLLKLASNETAATPAVLNTSTSELGHVGTHVGYGCTGTGSTGYTGGSSGTKRAGNNMIDVTGAEFGFTSRALLADFDNPGVAGDSSFGSVDPLDLEYCVAPGDSGGGMFADLGSGEVLVGVHSFLAWWDGEDGGDADYGDVSGSTRVSSFVAWINDTIAAEDAATPEPASLIVWSLLAALGITVGWRRRRQRPVGGTQ